MIETKAEVSKDLEKALKVLKPVYALSFVRFILTKETTCSSLYIETTKSSILQSLENQQVPDKIVLVGQMRNKL